MIVAGQLPVGEGQEEVDEVKNTEVETKICFRHSKSFDEDVPLDL